MGAPKGNKNALGNKGGGRARAVDIEKLWALWNGEIDLDDLKVNYHPDTGMVGETAFDDLAWKVLRGNEKARKMLLDKLFPRPVIRKLSQPESTDRSIREMSSFLTPDFLK